jgi:hypothetical protein
VLPQHQRRLSPFGKRLIVIGLGVLAFLALALLFLVPTRFGPVGW